jgi:hypothetical protein
VRCPELQNLPACMTDRLGKFFIVTADSAPLEVSHVLFWHCCRVGLSVLGPFLGTRNAKHHASSRSWEPGTHINFLWKGSKRLCERYIVFKNGFWNGFAFLGNGTLKNENPDTPIQVYDNRQSVIICICFSILYCVIFRRENNIRKMPENATA